MKKSWLKSHPGKINAFSDEENFSVDASTNRRNSCYHV